jgi:hypothetical protein
MRTPDAVIRLRRIISAISRAYDEKSDVQFRIVVTSAEYEEVWQSNPASATKPEGGAE